MTWKAYRYINEINNDCEDIININDVNNIVNPTIYNESKDYWCVGLIYKRPQPVFNPITKKKVMTQFRSLVFENELKASACYHKLCNLVGLSDKSIDSYLKKIEKKFVQNTIDRR